MSIKVSLKSHRDQEQFQISLKAAARLLFIVAADLSGSIRLVATNHVYVKSRLSNGNTEEVSFEGEPTEMLNLVELAEVFRKFGGHKVIPQHLFSIKDGRSGIACVTSEHHFRALLLMAHGAEGQEMTRALKLSNEELKKILTIASAADRSVGWAMNRSNTRS